MFVLRTTTVLTLRAAYANRTDEVNEVEMTLTQLRVGDCVTTYSETPAGVSTPWSSGFPFCRDASCIITRCPNAEAFLGGNWWHDRVLTRCQVTANTRGWIYKTGRPPEFRCI